MSKKVEVYQKIAEFETQKEARELVMTLKSLQEIKGNGEFKIFKF